MKVTKEVYQSYVELAESKWLTPMWKSWVWLAVRNRESIIHATARRNRYLNRTKHIRESYEHYVYCCNQYWINPIIDNSWRDNIKNWISAEHMIYSVIKRWILISNRIELEQSVENAENKHRKKWDFIRNIWNWKTYFLRKSSKKICNYN